MPEIVINEIPVRFPFDPYDVQKNYMDKLIQCLQKRENGILESPTGTGKTLCLLCATLAWLELKKAEYSARRLCANLPEGGNPALSSISSQILSTVGGWKPGGGCPKIIFSSRTHSQLSQAVNELKKTTYRHMKVSVLGSRDQMCIHPEVSKETNNHNKVHLCQARVKARNCYFYNQVEHRKLDPETKENMDIEDIVKLGKKKSFCPYYMAREIRQDADIIFLPYNYLLDPKSRRAHGIELQGNIVIFDEAHNVEKMCEESASLQFCSTDVALCIDEVTQVMQKLQELVEKYVGTNDDALIPEDFSAEDLYILKTIFLELEKAIDAIKIPNDGSGVTFPGCFMFELLEKADITPNKKVIILDVLDKLIQYLTTNSSSPFQRKGIGLQKFSELIKIVFSKENFTLSYMEFVKQCYKVHVTVEEKKKFGKNEGWGAQKTINAKTGKTLSYWCFNPGFGMKDLAEQGVQCIILTSGTLSPLDVFTSELQIPFPIQLENPHIIKPCQVWVGTVCKGPDGITLNSSYQNRSKPEYINSLGQTILTFSRVIPGGLLVFFPSYPIMKLCQENWQNSGIWTRLNNMKPVFVEPQTKGGFIETMEEFYIKVRDPELKGACFMAVCRGKVSEGLDFADRNGRAVIVTGLPYPPFKDPRVLLKQQYLEEARARTKKGLTGPNWYKLEASRAVNQAIGRVIRHKDDYGAIILCDKRFGDQNFRMELSAWVKPYMKTHETFGPALRDIIQFFRVTQSMFPESEIKERELKKHLKIEYEHDTKASNSRPSTLFPQLASAFQPVFSRSINSHNSKEKINASEVEQISDPDSLYKSEQPISKSLPDPSPKEKQMSFFSALEKGSSVLNFNVVNDDKSFKLNHQESISVVPKRKKIKLVSEAQRNHDKFVKNTIKSATVTTGINSSPDLFKEENCEFEKNQNIIDDDQIPCYQTNKNIDSNLIKQAKIIKYIKEVKSLLSTEEYKIFSNAIKEYKSSLDCDSMIATVLSLFGSSSSRYHFILKFAVFLRPEHRIQLESIYNDLINSS